MDTKNDRLNEDTVKKTRNRQLNKLNAYDVKNAKYGEKPSNKYIDGAGLYLLVMPNESKYWRMDYTRPNKKRNTLALGVYDKSTGEISLSKARDMRNEARALLKAGIDPADDRDQKKYDLIDKHTNTFEALAIELLAIRNKEDHEFKRRLNKNIYPYIGRKPVSQVTTVILEREIFARLIEQDTLPLAEKVKGDIFKVLDFARRRKLIPDNPAEDVTLPKPIEGNYPALIDPIEIAKLVKDMWSYDQRRGVSPATAPALKLSIMTFLRPGELRSLKWSSYKREDKILLLQSLKRDNKSNKKQGNQPKENHIVPLSRQAIEVLESIYQFTGNSEYVFFNPTGKEPYLSEGTVNGALIRLGYKGEQTAHGLRATARTMLDERLDCRTDWIEHQLAHTVKDTNGTAYNRTKHLDKRFEMMQAWIDYLDQLRTSE